MKTETYLKQIADAEKLIAALDQVCTTLEQANGTRSNTYRTAMDERYKQQAAIERWKKFVAIKQK